MTLRLGLSFPRNTHLRSRVLFSVSGELLDRTRVLKLLLDREHFTKKRVVSDKLFKEAAEEAPSAAALPVVGRAHGSPTKKQREQFSQYGRKHSCSHNLTPNTLPSTFILFVFVILFVVSQAPQRREQVSLQNQQRKYERVFVL